MYDKYTERARRIVYLTEALAKASCCPQAGTGHLLLAITYEPDSTAARALDSLGLTPDTIRDALTAVLDGAPAAPWASTLPLSPRLHSVLQDAAGDAISSGHAHVGTDHLLLAAITDREPPDGCGGWRGTAVEIFARLGIEPAAVRAAMHATLRGDLGQAVITSGQDHDTAAVHEEVIRQLGRVEWRLAEHARNADRRLGKVEEQLEEHMGDTLEVRRKLGLVDLHVVPSGE